MRALIVGTVVVLALVVVFVGCNKDTTPAGGGGTANAAVIEQKTCPVMGKALPNKDIFREYKGRKIYFCCNMCPAEFDKDPEKYVKIVDEEIARLKKEAEEKKTQ